MYLCSKGCGKRFVYSDNRNAHEKYCAEGGIGDSDKIHICFCGSAYSRKSKLKVSPNKACFRLFIKIESPFITFFVSGTSAKESWHHGATCAYRERTR